MIEKLRALIVLLVIIITVICIYMSNKYLEKWIRPRESMLRFLAYLFTGLTIIFTVTFLLVFLIAKVFATASR